LIAGGWPGCCMVASLEFVIARAGLPAPVSARAPVLAAPVTKRRRVTRGLEASMMLRELLMIRCLPNCRHLYIVKIPSADEARRQAKS
jgi:hypothetical protein